MSNINIKRFTPGTAPAAQAQEINDLADSATQSGIDVSSHINALNQSIDRDDNNGFQQGIYSLKNHIALESNKIAKKNSANAIALTLKHLPDSAKQVGVPVNINEINDARSLLDNGQVEAAKSIADRISKTIDTASADIAKNASTLNTKRLEKEVTPENQAKADKMFADKLLDQLNNVYNIAKDPQAETTFTNSPLLQQKNKAFGIGENISANLKSITGFNLANALKEIKETTGASPRLAQIEINAFASAKTPLSIHQSYQAAQDSLDKYKASLLRNLDTLGVKPEFTTPEGTSQAVHSTNNKLQIMQSNNDSSSEVGTGQATQPAADPDQPFRDAAKALANINFGSQAAGQGQQQQAQPVQQQSQPVQNQQMNNGQDSNADSAGQ